MHWTIKYKLWLLCGEPQKYIRFYMWSANRYKDINTVSHLTFTRSVGVPMKPPVKPDEGKTTSLNAILSIKWNNIFKYNVSYFPPFTSKGTQEDFLVERHRTFIFSLHLIPDGLVNGKSWQRICHLDKWINKNSYVKERKSVRLIKVLWKWVLFLTCRQREAVSPL